jgi:hypothetical protein
MIAIDNPVTMMNAATNWAIFGAILPGGYRVAKR